jgi:membrane protease YdiL (CAAX protease family)
MSHRQHDADDIRGPDARILPVVRDRAPQRRVGVRDAFRTRRRAGPVGLYLVATAVANGFTSANITLSTIGTALFSLHAGFFVSLFLRGALGEELGLRGFALPYLQARMSPFRASLIIGVLWGAWHLPVLIGRDLLSIVAFSLLSIGLSMLFTWLFNGSGGSLIPVLLFHASQNWEEGFETLFPGLVGTEWELVSTLSLLVVGVVAGVLVWRNGRKHTPKTE